MKTSKETATADFLDENLITHLLVEGSKATSGDALMIIDKARKAQGLTPEETAVLLQSGETDVLHALFQAAKEVK